MDELKTLKDMNTYSDDINYPTINDLISKEQLKAEAVKWVKRIHNRSYWISPKDFMNFFNLTEEDLK